MKLSKYLLIVFVVSLYLAPMVGADYTDPYLEIAKIMCLGIGKSINSDTTKGSQLTLKQFGVVQTSILTYRLQRY